MEVGRVRYARSGDARIAFREFGEGENTLVFTPGWVSNLDHLDDPINPMGGVIERLSESLRVVTFDKRGTGLSDPVDHAPPLDERMDDLHAVMDAAGLDGPTNLFGVSEGGPMSILFAATYPERVRTLSLYGTVPRFARGPDYPWGTSPEQHQVIADEIEAHWGDGALAEFLFGADVASLPGFIDEFARGQRASASPRMARLLWQSLTEIDVRGILGAVRTPTLVMTRHGDKVAPIQGATMMAAAIPGAQLVELPPGPHALFGDELTTAILDFVGGQPATHINERVLMSVLFTDIVGSTEQLSTQGDSRWSHQLDAHDRLVDNALARYGGRRAKHTGDGVFALFDGPTKAARCGLELVPALATRGIRIRAGVHIGECERRGDEWSGMAVHVGARIGAMAGSGEVLTSRTVRDLSAGSGLLFESLGLQRLKGIPDDHEVFRVRN